MHRSEEDRAIREVVERLTKTFPDAQPDEVARVVEEARPEFEQSPIRDFVPLFVERSAKHRLLHRARRSSAIRPGRFAPRSGG
jgi:hypothetical protein